MHATPVAPAASGLALPGAAAGTTPAPAAPAAAAAAAKVNAEAFRLREELLQAAEALPLPPNFLDLLIDELGGPGAVAEMTGRKARIARHAVSGRLEYQVRGNRHDDTPPPPQSRPLAGPTRTLPTPRCAPPSDARAARQRGDGLTQRE